MRGYQRTGPYRSRTGLILGVCKGLAQYFNISVFWTRAIAVAALIFTGVWPVVGVYLLAAVLMKPEPMVPFRNEGDQEFYNSYTASRAMALQRLKRTYENLDRRLRRMELSLRPRTHTGLRALQAHPRAISRPSRRPNASVTRARAAYACGSAIDCVRTPT